MNNITLRDIDQNRPSPKHTCFGCRKEFMPSEQIIHNGGIDWTAFDYHPKCFDKRQQRIFKSAISES